MWGMSERVNCPICQADSGTPCRPTAADIVKCDLCETVYLRTRPNIEELERHYQNYADNPGSHMKLPDTIEAAKQSGLRREYFMEQILREVRDGLGDEHGWFLDIGCGWGAFLDNARDKGFKPVGVEICRRMSDYANQTLGISVSPLQLEKLPLQADAYSVVSLIHSLEHLPNQRDALEFIHRILKPKGLLCGIVPNFGSFCSQRMLNYWPWLDPSMHYVHFTPVTLAAALTRFSFEPLAIYTKTGDFDPAIIKKYFDRDISELEIRGEGEEIRFFAIKI